MRVAILMTCHNRRETTLRCLASLREAQVKASGEGEGLSIDIFLNDDGSTDGTAETVQKWSDPPSSTSTFHLHLLCGSGRDYWAKGMARAWRSALDYEKESAAFTFYLWLNDDVVLNPDSLFAALRLSADNSSGAVVVGELANARGEIVYGTRGDRFTGNFVLIPRAVYEKVGGICGGFRHAWADSDYAMRCKRAGVPVVSCGVVGTCEGHPIRPSLSGRNLRWRWRSLWDPKGWCVHDLWLYRRRNWGCCAAVFSCLHLILHVVFFKNEA